MTGRRAAQRAARRRLPQLPELAGPEWGECVRKHAVGGTRITEKHQNPDLASFHHARRVDTSHANTYLRSIFVYIGLDLYAYICTRTGTTPPFRALDCFLDPMLRKRFTAPA
jgi:hypothetical protein